MNKNELLEKAGWFFILVGLIHVAWLVAGIVMVSYEATRWAGASALICNAVALINYMLLALGTMFAVASKQDEFNEIFNGEDE